MTTTVTTEAVPAEPADRVIGLNVHNLLFARGARHKELAMRLGITSSVMSKKLRGTSAWSAQQIATTAEFLGVEPGRLFRKVTVPSITRQLPAFMGEPGNSLALRRHLTLVR